MGAGASTSTALSDFGAFGDVHAVKSLCTELGKEFDQVKFDELKDEDGFVTKDQIEALISELSVQTVTDAPMSAASTIRSLDVPSKGPITINILQLNEAIAAATAAGLTPLIVDNSENHIVDNFFGYNAVMIDAKQISLDVARKKITPEDGLSKARKCLVSALQNGRTMVVSMQQGSPSFNTWFNSAADWPAEAIFSKCGRVFIDDKDFPASVMRPEDTARHSGFAVCDPKFSVVATTWFSPEDFEEFLFGEKMGLSQLSKELFQFIIVTV